MFFLGSETTKKVLLMKTNKYKIYQKLMYTCMILKLQINVG
jgi:hypothetical protein